MQMNYSFLIIKSSEISLLQGMLHHQMLLVHSKLKMLP